jgi:pimeloyl-ACP methyl ester carboxylesterase
MKMTTTSDTIHSRFATVNGLKLHYLTAGHGPTVILLHGYAQNSRMWRPVISVLAQKFTVIAPDLPGFGESDIPSGHVSMKWSAGCIHDLAKSLDVQKAAVVGHDIGLMVAYAYAAQFPSETEKLVLMDAFLPGVAGWETYYNDPGMWHFRFNGPIPEALVNGRERIYFEHYWNDFAADKTHSIRKPIEWHTRKPTRAPAACALAGLISSLSLRPQKISLSSPKTSSRCRC